MCIVYIVSDRLYVLGGEAVSYRERCAYHDHDHDHDEDEGEGEDEDKDVKKGEMMVEE